MNQSHRGYNHDRMCHLLYRGKNDLKKNWNELVQIKAQWT